MGQSKVDLSIIIGIERVVVEIEVAEENEIVEFMSISTIKSVRFPNLGSTGG